LKYQLRTAKDKTGSDVRAQISGSYSLGIVYQPKAIAGPKGSSAFYPIQVKIARRAGSVVKGVFRAGSPPITKRIETGIGSEVKTEMEDRRQSQKPGRRAGTEIAALDFNCYNDSHPKGRRIHLLALLPSWLAMAWLISAQWF
jgi:hypothetical protein